jgi:hypothetical protein
MAASNATQVVFKNNVLDLDKTESCGASILLSNNQEIDLWKGTVRVNGFNLSDIFEDSTQKIAFTLDGIKYFRYAIPRSSGLLKMEQVKQRIKNTNKLKGIIKIIDITDDLIPYNVYKKYVDDAGYMDFKYTLLQVRPELRGGKLVKQYDYLFRAFDLNGDVYTFFTINHFDPEEIKSVFDAIAEVCKCPKQTIINCIYGEE